MTSSRHASAILALGLALVVSLSMATHGQVDSNADLALEGLAPGDPVAGATHNLTATVTNNGPDPATGFTVSFYWNEQGQHLNGDASSSQVDRSSTVLQSGESERVRLPWRPSIDQSGNGHVIASVEAGDQTNDPTPDNNQQTTATFVTLPGVHANASWSTSPIEVEQGAQRDLAFTVRNDGNVEGTFVPELAEPSSSESEGWSFHVTPESASLGPGALATFALTVEVPEQAKAGTTIDGDDGLLLRVVEEGYRDSTHGHEKLPTPELVVSTVRDIDLAVADPAPGKPGETLQGSPVHVTNRGNTNETVDLDRSTSQGTLPSDWTVRYTPATVELDAHGETTQPRAEVQLPENATAGTYELVTVATARGGSLPPTAQATSTVHVQQVYGLDTETLRGSVDVLPDETARLRLAATNTGNGNDTVNVTAEAPASGWTVQPVPADRRLAPGASHLFEIRVRPPATIAPREGVSIPVHVQTGGGADAARETLNLTANVTSGPNLHLDDPPQDRRIDPASSLTIPLTVVNGGNEQGKASVEVSVPEGWEASLSRADVGPLTPGETASTRLTVTAPEGALPGNQATASIEVQGDGASDAASSSLELTVGGPDLVARILEAPDRLPAGTSKPVQVGVTNEGVEDTSKARLVLEARGNQGTTTLHEWTLPALAPGDNRTFTARWDASGWRGPALLTAQADPGNEVVEETDGNNEDTHEAFVVVTDLSVSTPPPRVLFPGQSIRADTPSQGIAVANQGNSRVQATVHVEDEAGWVNRTRQLEIPAGASQPVPVEVTVPRPAGLVQNNVSVTATVPAPSPDSTSTPGAGSGSSGTNDSWTGTWTLSVRDVAPPRVENVSWSSTPRWGANGTLLVEWDDGTGIRGGEARIAPPDGPPVERPLAVEDGTVRLPWTPQTAGPVLVNLTLTDLAGNTAHSRPFEVPVAPPEPPEIGAPNQTRVAPGTPVPLDVRSLAPLASVTATVDGREQRLDAPYRLNTSGWTEAPHLVRVQAVDATGQATNHTLNVTVDATPPELVSASVQPTDPEPGEEVRVELSFDEPVQEASVVLVTEDGTRIRETATASADANASQTTDANPDPNAVRATSQVTIRFTFPDASIERADVQATDPAGLTGTFEGAASLSGGLPVPVAPVPLIAAALVGAAVLLKRRSHSDDPE